MNETMNTCARDKKDHPPYREAALVAQGCAEIRWLAGKMGAKPETLSAGPSSIRTHTHTHTHTHNTCLVIRPFIHTLIWFIRPFIHTLIWSSIHSHTHLVIRPFTHSFGHPSIHTLIYLIIRPFTYTHTHTQHVFARST